MSETISYSIFLEAKERAGYIVRVPALPEVAAGGATENEAMENAEGAIRTALAYRREHGLPIPTGPSFEEHMRSAEDIMTRYRTALDILAHE